jgi:DNA-binding NarL/FixJ family response regulator
MRPARRVDKGDSLGRESPHRLLIVTKRPAVYHFFSELGSAAALAASERMDVSVDAIEARADDLGAATAAIVDVGLEPATAVQFCRELRSRRPDLPVTAVVCCPHALTPWLFRALVAAGVESLIDLETAGAEALDALRRVARGETVLGLRLGMHKLELLRDLLAGHRLRLESQTLLEYVARGLSDREIGLRVHLSPHTVKKHIEQLRDQLGAHNRTELAAWAGRQGLYTPEPRQTPDKTYEAAREVRQMR